MSITYIKDRILLNVWVDSGSDDFWVRGDQSFLDAEDLLEVGLVVLKHKFKHLGEEVWLVRQDDGEVNVDDSEKLEDLDALPQ